MTDHRPRIQVRSRRCAELALLCLGVLAITVAAPGQTKPDTKPIGAAATPTESADGKLTAEQLHELAGPLALYPDALLTQVLPPSTNPLQIVQAARWLKEQGGKVDMIAGFALVAYPADYGSTGIMTFVVSHQVTEDTI